MGVVVNSAFLRPSLVLERGRWVAKIRVQGRPFQRTLTAATESAAREELAALESLGLHEALFQVGPANRVSPADLHDLLRKTKAHAAERGISFALTKPDAYRLLKDSRGRCAVSGLPFDQRFRAPRAAKRPYAASIDRVECARGYEAGNVRLVCAIVNIAMGQWGEDALVRVATALVLRRNPR